MTDIPVNLDPLASDYERANPPRTIIFADGEPVEFRRSPPAPILPDLIARAEQLGAESIGFFGNRRPSWERR